MSEKRLGEYLLLDLINHGGMADIYIAKAFGFGGADQIIAVKCIRPDVSQEPDFVKMFVDEAKLTVLLDHQNIAKVFELGRTAAGYYIAMEHVAGRDLRAVLDRARARGIHIPEHLALHITAQVCEALDYAHGKSDPTGVPLQIVHRDVSPQNVLISYDGEVKVIDFGIAKAATQATRAGPTGILKGKYGYMAPEQVRGEAVDSRTDIFAAGILLYELMTQRRLFEGSSDFSILEKVRYAEVYPPSLITPRIPMDLEGIILRSLALRQDDRYQSASDLADAVVQVMLQRYGQPSARELSNLMHSLFEEEIREDQTLLDVALKIEVMPEGIEDMGTPLPASVDEVAAPVARPRATIVDRPGSAERAAAEIVDQADDSAELDGPTDETGGGRVGAPGVEDTDSGRRTQRNSPQAERLTESTDPGSAAPLFDSDARKPAPRKKPAPRRKPEARRDTGPGAIRRMTPPVEVKPTEILSAYKRGRRIPREVMIVAAALILALALIVATWIGTRGPKAPPGGAIMVVSVPSGATVDLDGRPLGTTPVSFAGVAPGPHRLTLEKKGFEPVVRDLTIVAEERLDVNVRLRRVRK